MLRDKRVQVGSLGFVLQAEVDKFLGLYCEGTIFFDVDPKHPKYFNPNIRFGLVSVEDVETCKNFVIDLSSSVGCRLAG